MKDFRIGTDIKVKWHVTINEGTVPIEGADLTLQLVNPLGQRAKIPFDLLDGKVVAIVYGKDQTMLGAYAFTLWLNYGKADQTAIDHIDAFRLVASSNLIEGKDDCDNLQTGATVNLSGMMSVGVQGASAYEIWLRNGHTGTEDDFLAWLKGPQGDPGAPGSDGNGIERIEKTATEGKFDTYTIYFTDGTTYEYIVKNGEDAIANAYTKKETDATFAKKVDHKQDIQSRYMYAKGYYFPDEIWDKNLVGIVAYEERVEYDDHDDTNAILNVGYGLYDNPILRGLGEPASVKDATPKGYVDKGLAGKASAKTKVLSEYGGSEVKMDTNLAITTLSYSVINHYHDVEQALKEKVSTDDVVHTTGQATDKVMSQKAVSVLIGNVEQLLASI